MRRGITPVVAVVLLLMMSVTAAGSAYTWITTTTQQAQTETSRALDTSISVKDVTCDRGAVSLALANDGSTTLSGSTTLITVHDPDGGLVASRSIDTSGSGFKDPGGFDRVDVLTGHILDAREQHRIEVTFMESDHTVTTSCQVRQGSLIDRFYGIDWGNKQWSAFDTDWTEVSPMDQTLGDKPIDCTTEGIYLYTNHRNGKICRNSIANNSKGCINMTDLAGFDWGGQGITMLKDRIYAGTTGSYGANGNRIYAVDISDWSSPSIVTWWDASGHGLSEVAALARRGGYIYQTERSSDTSGVIEWEFTDPGASFSQTFPADSNMDNHGGTATGSGFYLSNNGEIDRFDAGWNHREHLSGLDLYTGVCAGYSGAFR